MKRWGGTAMASAWSRSSSPEDCGCVHDRDHFAHWDEVTKFLQRGEDKTTIDVGCGCGMSSRIYSLTTNGPVLAVDKPEVVGWSARLYPTPGVSFQGADLAGEWEFGKFDNIVCIDVIEHISAEG